MHNIRSHIATGALAILLAALNAGCMAPVQAVNAIERSSAQRDLDKGIAVLRAHIKALQDKGDPLGDYFYALGNSDGWIEDVKDPAAITRLFEKAAAKGSMDAKILLALQLATSEPIPGKLDYGKGPRQNLQAWEAGLGKLLPLLTEQCFARRLVLETGRPQMTSYSIAYEIWPTFRDGSSYKNRQGQWETLIPKDSERQKVWEEIHRNCRRPSDEWLGEANHKG
ncbi:hypothetical protein [Hydrogenophaga sp. RWCD_12]|uniref:hypothetical protein n=1 Tax=Hydrogenophaga sp. RWCD_12 TaxID=3391190 RepID=UPI0039854F43